mgnify:CR=1 FL=1
MTLHLILLLLAAAVLGVVICRSLGLPPILGYLLVGAVAGPHALGVLPDTDSAHRLAAFGVVFLMFTIGLEFSLPRLFAMKHIVFGLGLAQVLVTLLAVVVGALLWGVSWQASVALGGALAMSSTAILSKLLTDRRELDAAHGREVMGVLLFQDLAVVPLLVLIPALSQPVEALAGEVGWALAKAAVLLALVLFIGQRLMHAWFGMVARRKSSELFMLNVLLVTLAFATLTELAGLSPALGKDQGSVLDDLRPSGETTTPAGQGVRFQQYAGDLPAFTRRFLREFFPGATEADWSNWHWQIRNSIVSLEQIKRIASNVGKHVRYSGSSHSKTPEGLKEMTSEDQTDRKFVNSLNRFYDEVISVVRDAERVLIFGPGKAKGELETRFAHAGRQLQLVTIETVDKMTDRQIAAKVRDRLRVGGTRRGRC